MIQIGAFEAKTHFSEILRRVEKGEEFCVTNRGRIVAIIHSPQAEHERKTYEAFTKLGALRKKHPLGNYAEIKTWKEAGRK
jgi:prevent-host-death family protein